MAARYADLGDVTICYESIGDPTNPTLLLVMGLGCQMIEWDDELCDLFVAEGFHVVRLDNRDAGLSTFFPEPVDIFSVIQAISNGESPDVPYLLSDMGRDAIGVLDELGIDRAHVAGISLGGMISQVLAIEHPDRIATLTSIMSTPGPEVAPPTPAALNALLSPPPQTVEEMQDRRISNAAVWGSPGLYDEATLRQSARELYERHYDPTGSARQFAAIVASGNRTEQLQELEVPTLVIHGTEDNLIPLVGGEATAAAVPDAKLVVVEGMGHDLPRSLWPQLVESISAHAAQHPIDPRR
jgi:pimeloyl-ACP methyl ester carboxylesterase